MLDCVVDILEIALLALHALRKDLDDNRETARSCARVPRVDLIDLDLTNYPFAELALRLSVRYSK